MRHRATARFWECYNALPEEVQRLADRCMRRCALTNPQHPSLHFRQIGRFWSARVGLHYRALGVEDGQDRLVLDRFTRRVRPAD